MNHEDGLEPPTQSMNEHAIQTVVTAVASSAPLVGGPLSVAIQEIFGQKYSQRIERWQHEVAERIRKLEERGVSAEELAENDDFMDALVQATRVAGSTANAAKRARLANSLFNIGLGTSLASDKHAIYLRYLDELTESHMRLLNFFGDPAGHPENVAPKGMGSLAQLIEQALPDLYADRPLFETVHNDLERLGLSNAPNLGTVMTSDGLGTKRLTRKGEELINFITEPQSD